MPLRRGGLRVGQWYLGVNRRGAVVWPTRNVVTALDPGRAMAWHTTSSGATWTYGVAATGDRTRLTLRREMPHGLTRLAKVFGGALLGGAEQHADELEDGIRCTLERIKAAVES